VLAEVEAHPGPDTSHLLSGSPWGERRPGDLWRLVVVLA
jgi:hypothetical protein